MIILAEGAPASFEKRYKGNRHVGHLLTPRSLNVKQVLESGLPWGVDCESVRGFELDRYLCLLDRLVGLGARGCKFLAWAQGHNHGAHLQFSAIVRPRNAWSMIDLQGNSVAVVDGVYGFVLAGDAKWRQENLALAILVKQAREAGKWVHARDVCSSRQARSMANLGCSSCSLPHYGRFNYERFEPLVLAAEQSAREPNLFSPPS